MRRTLRHALTVTAFGMITVLVAACGGAAGSGSATDALAGDWLLTSGTAGGAGIPLVDGYDITLSIDGENWGGTAACNAYGATVTVSGSQLTVQEVFQTEMACIDDGVMESEATYLQAFMSVRGYEMDHDRLELRGDDVDVLLTYSRAPLEDDAPNAGSGP